MKICSAVQGLGFWAKLRAIPTSLLGATAAIAIVALLQTASACRTDPVFVFRIQDLGRSGEWILTLLLLVLKGWVT